MGCIQVANMKEANKIMKKKHIVCGVQITLRIAKKKKIKSVTGSGVEMLQFGLLKNIDWGVSKGEVRSVIESFGVLKKFWFATDRGFAGFIFEDDWNMDRLFSEHKEGKEIRF